MIYSHILKIIGKSFNKFIKIITDFTMSSIKFEIKYFDINAMSLTLE